MPATVAQKRALASCEHVRRRAHRATLGGEVGHHPFDAVVGDQAERPRARALEQVGEPLRMFGRYTTAPARIIQTRRPPVWWEGLTPMPAVDVQRAVLSQVGARPWDRDMRDVLLIAGTAFVLCCLSTLYPAWRAARLDPVEGLNR